MFFIQPVPFLCADISFLSALWCEHGVSLCGRVSVCLGGLSEGRVFRVPVGDGAGRADHPAGSHRLQEHSLRVSALAHRFTPCSMFLPSDQLLETPETTALHFRLFALFSN